MLFLCCKNLTKKLLSKQATQPHDLASEQDWCMAEGIYDFYGTYRSPHDRAEEGLLYAPGRFQGTILTGQNDESVYFHLVNMTYGNDDSPHSRIHSIPGIYLRHAHEY
jgi:hypothetical protein